MALQQEPKVKNRNAQPESVQSGPGPMEQLIELKTKLEFYLEKEKELTAKIADYEKRLDVGAEKIETALNQGKDVYDWENFWIILLHEYEEYADDLKNIQQSITKLQETLAA